MQNIAQLGAHGLAPAMTNTRGYIEWHPWVVHVIGAARSTVRVAGHALACWMQNVVAH